MWTLWAFRTAFPAANMPAADTARRSVTGARGRRRRQPSCGAEPLFERLTHAVVAVTASGIRKLEAFDVPLLGRVPSGTG